ncbi:hypothetical protein KSF_063240 [Reticulibacter mediterranei]|uniref:AAA+ ATPase domain-containing protein n=1 Tax=Reticulibacter mediterranei TaxID=2778369 RepID=A0A8J3IVY2_9CHLR|nr:AAA family ATPase [Reticulibacter mediterranei]GHO96276.1 hypothetical protein KSF_063240 [Reticulibacter mediterranei]
MRLRKIKIKEYRTLKNFTLDCIGGAEETKDYTLHLIVGVNGTGKSTLLRLLARLFLQLKNEQQRNPPFGFVVSYQLKQNDEEKVISITNLDEEGNHISGSEGLYIRRETIAQYETGDHESYVPFDATQHTNDLPPRIIAFTTGNEEEWIEALQFEDQSDNGDDEELQFPDPEQPGYQDALKEWYLQELPGTPIEDEKADDTQKTEEIRTDHFYFLSAEQIPLVALCGMLVDMKDASTTESSSQWRYLSNIMQESRIKALNGFSLRLRMNKEALLEPDKGFIQELLKLATHTIQIGSDYLLVFDLLAKKTLPNDLLALRGGGGFLFFSSLARLAQAREQNEQLLQEVNLFLERSQEQEERDELGASVEQPPLHLFTWLSDGEQSFLGRLCLMPLLRESEALILLDEPEVHFNDYWKQQLVFMLDESLTIPQDRPKPQPCHALMTTHSSITLTDVVNTNILILKRRNGYTYETIPTSLETLGADPSDIIVSVFGARHAAGANGVNRIKQKLESIRKIASEWQQLPSNIKNQCIKDLENLEKQVGPGYWRFLILRQIHDLRGR